MNFISGLLNKYKKSRDDEYINAVDSMTRWSTFMTNMLNTDGIISQADYMDQINDLYICEKDIEALNKRYVLFQNDIIEEFKQLFPFFQDEVNSFESNIDNHNNEYYKELINNARNLIGPIEGHDLDDQQMMCIIKDAHNHNVVAGAGTGKTTTIIGKVKYLIQTVKYRPEDILVLSYTHAAAAEMKSRLTKNLNCNISVSTFHRLGYHIMTTVEKKKPLIFTDSLRQLLKKELNELVKDREYRKRLLQYLGNSAGTEKSDLDGFDNYASYKTYVQEHRPVTLRGELVKSYGEMRVANTLAINSVKYIYEKKYEYDTATEEYAQYKPDFYLPDYGLYIEFFGIDRQGNTPEWFEGDDPTQTYQESIRWKRKTHKKYGTKMIECYAYEDAEGILEEQLEKKLRQNGVKLEPASLEAIFSQPGTSAESVLNSFLSSAESIIHLARNKRVSADSLLDLAGNDRKTALAAVLVSPLQKYYEDYLVSTHQIDFSDMLNKAQDYIAQGRYHNTFKYVIVDEYQDITASQFRLLQAMRNDNDFKLFCVGDDWQSIYRFNGSDVSYIMDFKEFWGESILSRIETTYRFSQSLIDVSSHFVMKNPRQIKKKIKSGIDSDGFAVSKIEGYKASSAIQFMTDRLMYLPKNSTVYLIGRYTFDVKLLETEPRLSIKFDTSTQTQKVYLQRRPDLTITFYTAHRSKGLQADYVFILNNTDGVLGFPSRVENNPLTDLLLEHSDSYEYAEERRLFYVALTRAKKHVYLLTVKDKESDFERELEEDFRGSYRNETYICPNCGGKLHIINGKFGKSLGCENYNAKNCRFSSRISSESK